MIDLGAIWRDALAADPVLLERPDYRFDPTYYAAANPALGGDPNALLAHYEAEGRAAGRHPTRFRELRAQQPDIARRLKRLITDPDLRGAMQERPVAAGELAFELMRLGHDTQISNFSRVHYLRSNPDVAKAGMNALEHYLLHGMREGRSTLARLRKLQYEGDRPFDPDLPTCLLALHELSNTGAPHVGLDLAKEASRTHNVIVAALRSGPLLQQFREAVYSVVITSNPFADFDYFAGEGFNRIDVAVCNSVESYPFIRVLVARDIPFASYIHEYTWYTFPTYKTIFTALYSDLLAFTSKHVRDSWLPVLKDVEFNVLSNSVIIPQRSLSPGTVSSAQRDAARERLSRLIGRDCSNLRIVCGAGYVQWRKGTDIFAMTAQISGHRDPDTIYVWVGDGLNFEDTQFGAWMVHHLDQAQMGEPSSNLFMLPAGDHYRDVLAASDAMLLSSRLDPLPNVVFDAVDAGCHVVLFEGASGFTDLSFSGSERFTRVEYANPDAAARVLLNLPRKATQSSDHESADIHDEVFREILEQLHASRKCRSGIVLGASSFDVPVLFSSSAEDAELRIRERERLFSNRRYFLWRDASDAIERLAASDNWVHRACSVTPYRSMDASDASQFSIHVHAFYANEFLPQLDSHKAFREAKRLVVTTDTIDKQNRIRAGLASRGLCGEVRVVPNQGRDIVPFLELFDDDELDAGGEIWGHFHQKKSVASSADGDVWREFMFATLLGDANRISVALSEVSRSEVGLVAPLDPHVGQWNASRSLIPKFDISSPGPIPDNPLVYPMGNMFWVRGEVVMAMKEIFPADYPWPNEPIPNDGTEYHFIERLWPTIAAKCGLSSVFVSKPDQRRRL